MIAHDPYWGPALTFKDTTITFALIGYAFVSALLPVWLILAPRDYLVTFLKIGVIVGLALGIVLRLKMPAMTQYIDGTGPLWKGAVSVSVHHHRPRRGIWLPRADLFRYDSRICWLTKPCAFHWLRRVTPTESFVAIMALVAASIIEPGLYFAS